MWNKVVAQFAIKILLGALRGAKKAFRDEIGGYLQEVPNDVLEKGITKD